MLPTSLCLPRYGRPVWAPGMVFGVGCRGLTCVVGVLSSLNTWVSSGKVSFWVRYIYMGRQRLAVPIDIVVLLCPVAPIGQGTMVTLFYPHYRSELHD